MNSRQPEYPIDPLFVQRWSPRAMSGETISKQELMSLFEAARWAPSSYNNQPWRFIYAVRGAPDWQRFFDLLTAGNQIWAKNASALIVIISHKLFEFNGKPSRTHSFDAGAAWENLALQGTIMDLVIHGMEGFDYDRARQELGIPKDYDVEAMVVIGKHGKLEELPEKLRQQEAPSERKPLAELVFEGTFKT
jgi:nitroreductase